MSRQNHNHLAVVFRAFDNSRKDILAHIIFLLSYLIKMKTRRTKNQSATEDKIKDGKPVSSKIPRRSRKAKAKVEEGQGDVNNNEQGLAEETSRAVVGRTVKGKRGQKSETKKDDGDSTIVGKKTARGRKRLVVECEPLESSDIKKLKVKTSAQIPEKSEDVMDVDEKPGTSSQIAVRSEDEKEVDAKPSRRGTYTMTKAPKVEDRRGTFTVSKPPKLSDRRGTFTIPKLEEIAISEEEEYAETIAEEHSVEEGSEKVDISVVKEETETLKGKSKKRAPKEKKTEEKEKSTSSKKAKKKGQPWDEDVIDLALKESNLKRTNTNGDKFTGAHVSIVGGLWNAVHEAVHLGARSFAMFLKSQRTWNCKPLKDEDAEKFKHTLKTYRFPPSMVVPHGSYLMNCGAPNDETLAKSRAMLVDELQRCDRLGLDIFNFHPGSTCGQISVDECLQRIADSINHALKQSTSVSAVIENMSCQGNTVGGKFTELRRIIDLVEDKSRIGICLDTCHAFAAGYGLDTEAGFNHMMTDLEEIVGLEYLKALHINDSKGAVGCHLDRHENIGKGQIGIEGFKRIMNDPRFNNIPLILETPEDDYSIEIKLLNKLIE